MTTRKLEQPPVGPPADPGATLSIGALSRASGIPVATLRTWESRYGYPQPERRDSGQRVYAVASVARLRQAAEAIARGHRARHVLTASDHDLQVLLHCNQPLPTAPAAIPGDTAAEFEALLRAVRAFDGAAVCHLLTAQSGRLGPIQFLEHCLGPLLHAVGERWASGALQIRHEHFLSQRIEDLLRALRHPYEERAAGPVVILGTLAGELHSLGLQMASLTLSVMGCRTCIVGTDTPVAQFAKLAEELPARAVAISMSGVNPPKTDRAQLRALRDAVPRRTTVIVGGSGAPEDVERVTVIHTFAGLAQWANSVVDATW